MMSFPKTGGTRLSRTKFSPGASIGFGKASIRDPDRGQTEIFNPQVKRDSGGEISAHEPSLQDARIPTNPDPALRAGL